MRETHTETETDTQTARKTNTPRKGDTHPDRLRYAHIEKHIHIH